MKTGKKTTRQSKRNDIMKCTINP